MQNEVKLNLEKIKSTKGVENVVLTQRDGNPIQYSGIWLSKEEIFSVSAATSAIYNCGLELHKDQLKYILIEGKKGSILLSPLRNHGNCTLNRIIEAQNLQGNDDEFFTAITTQPRINLGGILLKTRQSLIEIKKALILSGENFKPPLRHFSQEQIQNILQDSNTREEIQHQDHLNIFSMNISQNTYNQLEQVLQEFGKQTLDLQKTYITIDGGFTAASYSNREEELYSLDHEATMSYSLFSTANKCAWLLKKMQVDSILLECNNYFQFINKVNNGIFSTHVLKGRQKLGLLRLIIPRYCKKLTNIIDQAQRTEYQKPKIDFQTMFSELVF